MGRAVARRFAREGARVAVLARGQTGLDATLHELRSYGTDALALSVDVADAEQVRAAAERVERELGPIDVWINNAMTTVYGRVDDITPEEFRRVTDVTYHGYVWGTQAALAHMKPRNRGAIVQVGSSLAYRGIALQSAYCAAKHAIRGFTDALRTELLHEDVNIHITMVQLPAINTPQFDHCLNKMDKRTQPVPPVYQPEIAAEAIYYAARHRRRELYVGASTVKAIVAQKLLPGLADRFVASRVWDGQLTDEPARRDGKSNLFESLNVDAGAHGSFDSDAREHDMFSTVANRIGARGVRTLALMAPLVGLGVLLGRALAAPRDGAPPGSNATRRPRTLAPVSNFRTAPFN